MEPPCSDYKKEPALRSISASVCGSLWIWRSDGAGSAGRQRRLGVTGLLRPTDAALQLVAVTLAFLISGLAYSAHENDD